MNVVLPKPSFSDANPYWSRFRNTAQDYAFALTWEYRSMMLDSSTCFLIQNLANHSMGWRLTWKAILRNQLRESWNILKRKADNRLAKEK
jgi:hypothetical protein